MYTHEHCLAFPLMHCAARPADLTHVYGTCIIRILYVTPLSSCADAPAAVHPDLQQQGVRQAAKSKHRSVKHKRHECLPHDITQGDKSSLLGQTKGQRCDESTCTDALVVALSLDLLSQGTLLSQPLANGLCLIYNLHIGQSSGCAEVVVPAVEQHVSPLI